jgi:hypothetical protein
VVDENTLARDPSTQALAVARYASRIRAMSAADLTRETAGVQQDLEGTDSSWARMRLALLLSTPAASPHDERRVAGLLRGIEQRAAPGEEQLRDMAGLVAALLAGAPAGHAPPAIERDTALEQELRALRQTLTAERARRRELEQQVEALKKLEGNLSQRGAIPE